MENHLPSYMSKAMNFQKVKTFGRRKYTLLIATYICSNSYTVLKLRNKSALPHGSTNMLF